MAPATDPWPLTTDEGPRISSIRSRLNVFWGRITIGLGPSQMPSRSVATCDVVNPRIEKDDGAVGCSPDTTPAIRPTASLTF